MDCTIIVLCDTSQYRVCNECSSWAHSLSISSTAKSWCWISHLTLFQFGGTREWLTWSASKRGSRAPSNEQTLNSLVQAIKCSAFWRYAVWWATLQYNNLARLAMALELARTFCYDRALDYCIRIMIQWSEGKNEDLNYHSESTLLEDVEI